MMQMIMILYTWSITTGIAHYTHDNVKCFLFFFFILSELN